MSKKKHVVIVRFKSVGKSDRPYEKWSSVTNTYAILFDPEKGDIEKVQKLIKKIQKLKGELIKKGVLSVMPAIVPGEIRTYSGLMINILDMKPDDIRLEDIAHALSNQCRFSGHTRYFYSVAEHSTNVASIVPPEFKTAALLHDAAEAYLVDLPTPIKALLPDYKKYEDNIMRVIAAKFGFQYPLPEAVHIADKQALQQEWDGLMVGRSWRWCLSPEQAESFFLTTAFKCLQNDN